jgi:acetoin utilization deacetylase AcuC-like enzyme/pyrrolidone-carboxylate peptidase
MASTTTNCDVDVLVTSFGPFLNVAVNPSQTVMRHLAQSIDHSRRLRSSSTSVVHTTPRGVDDTLSHLKTRLTALHGAAAIVVHIGVARGSARPRLELVGINDLHCPQGDADGVRRDHCPIVSDAVRDEATSHAGSVDGDVVVGTQTPLPRGRHWITYDSKAHLPSAHESQDPADFWRTTSQRGTLDLEDAEPVDLSYDAGAYLCNYMLFRSLTVLAHPPPVAAANDEPRTESAVARVVAGQGPPHSSTGRAVVPLFFHIADGNDDFLRAQARSIHRLLEGLVATSRVFANGATVLLRTVVDLPCHPKRREFVADMVDALVPNLSVHTVHHENGRCPTDVMDAIVQVHSRHYVEALQKRSRTAGATHRSEGVAIASHLSSDCEDEDWGFEADASPYSGMWSDSWQVMSTTVRAVELLVTGRAATVLHWEGGRHHARFDSASGFCFLNDVALAATLLAKNGHRVLVVDFDAHHGDGTELMTAANPSVFTLSMHAFGKGVFPGTGAPSQPPSFAAPSTVLNVALPPGAGDTLAVKLWTKALAVAVRVFEPTVVVAVCGADGIGGDPLGNLNLSVFGLGHLYQSVVNLNLPLLALGSGGYVDSATARAFAVFSSVSNSGGGLPCGAVPDSARHFADCAPSFDLYSGSRTFTDHEGWCDREIATESETSIENFSKA